jgi:hypothetical protein
VLEWFPFGFGGIGFLKLFPNELRIQAAKAKLPLNSSPTVSLSLEAGLDEGFAKLPVVKISGGF